MSIYFSYYYTILAIYKKFSRDPQIAIFATGLFSVIISFNILFFMLIIRYFIDFNLIRLEIIGPMFILVYVINSIIFLRENDKNDERLDYYSGKISKNGIVIAILYSILVLFLSIGLMAIQR